MNSVQIFVFLVSVAVIAAPFAGAICVWRAERAIKINRYRDYTFVWILALVGLLGSIWVGSTAYALVGSL